jgi:S1-C subfamily serine protease
MAKSAADYLNADQERRLVILAGSGHVAFGSGIPSRLKRLTNATYAVVLSAGEEIEPGMADYVLLSERQELPTAGTLGIDMENKDGECRIRSVSPEGAGGKAGLRKGDVLLAVDDQPVQAVADVRLALWKKAPGDRVRVTVRRKRLFWTSERDYELELKAPRKTAAADP